MDEINLFLDNKVIQLTGIGSCNADAILVDIQINSIAFISLVVAIEGEYDIEFDDEMLLVSKFNTISDIGKYVLEKISKE